MSDNSGIANIDNSNSSLYNILKNCANLQSYETLPLEDYNDVCATGICDYYKIMSTNSYSTSGNSSSSFASDESFGDNIVEENGRISLAYENLRTIPRRIAEKFASQTKCLDLSYNNFQNLSFLTFFEELHTLILDRNDRLEVYTLPFLPNLKILWINNCDISNVSEWVQRIQNHCPLLEQLSIMGNPGINNHFNYCTLTAHCAMNISMPPSPAADYREYILNMLPNLEYLDGISRTAHYMRTTTTVGDLKNGRLRSSASCSTGNGNSASDQQTPNNRKTSPTLSFKDLFRLKRRKKSYQSSSTN